GPESVEDPTVDVPESDRTPGVRHLPAGGDEIPAETLFGFSGGHRPHTAARTGPRGVEHPQLPGHGPFPAQGTAPHEPAARLPGGPGVVRAVVCRTRTYQREARRRLLEGRGRQVAPVAAAHAASLGMN